MHEHFLMIALQQAQLGRGMCAPNPSVGAVAVQNNQIIAQAFHSGVGTSHAEVLVLSQFAQNTQDVVLYVTLEPCNHWGRTPPCVEAIIQHGIKCVVYAYADPNPIVQHGNSTQLLRQHGVEVLHYPLPLIDEFYISYTHWLRTKMPFVTVKAAQTLDGKIALPGGQRVKLSNAACDVFTHQQRQMTDVILTTARTVLHDDPRLTVRMQGATQYKVVAILDRALILPDRVQLMQTSTHKHIYHSCAVACNQPYANCSYHAINETELGLDLHAVILHLGSLGYHDVFVEAGGILFSALHAAGLVNRTYLYIVPKILGVEAVPLYMHNMLSQNSYSSTWKIMDDNVCLQLDWKDNVYWAY